MQATNLYAVKTWINTYEFWGPHGSKISTVVVGDSDTLYFVMWMVSFLNISLLTWLKTAQEDRMLFRVLVNT